MCGSGTESQSEEDRFDACRGERNGTIETQTEIKNLLELAVGGLA